MKHKIMLITLILISLLLCSCSLFDSDTESTKTVTSYEKYTLKNTPEELSKAIDKVADSNVILAIETAQRVGLRLQYSYELKSAVVYKKSGTKYYLTTSFDSDDYADSTSKAIKYEVILGEDYSNAITASIVGYDEANSVAVYQFTSSSSIGVSEVTSTFDTSVGDMVFSIATFGETATSLSTFDYEENAYNIYSGVLSHDEGVEIKHEAMTSDQNTGSPLYDYNGKLIGLNIYKTGATVDDDAVNMEDLSDFNFAIRNDALYKIINDIESSSSKSVERLAINGTFIHYSYVYGLEKQPYYKFNEYGVATTEFTFPTGMYNGIYVIKSGSGNSFKNMRSGDFINKANGVEIKSLNDLRNIIRLTTTSETVTLTVSRNGSTITYTN